MKIKHFGLLIFALIILISCKEEIVNAENYLMYNGYYYKQIKYDETSVARYADKIQAMYDMYLNDNMNIYYIVVPNKSLYIEEESDYNYNNVVDILNEKITFAEYIDISDALSIASYYKTDDYWKQEYLESIVKRLGEHMDFTIDFTKFTENRFDDFIGMYRVNIDELSRETLIYLTSEYTDNAIVVNMQHPDITVIYDIEKLDTETMYDIYLSGVSPLITITNELAETNRELIIFRDSYTSSLAPLLLETYSKITLIDSRFILMDLIGDYVEFNTQDVIFMYSEAVINNSLLLK